MPDDLIPLSRDRLAGQHIHLAGYRAGLVVYRGYIWQSGEIQEESQVLRLNETETRNLYMQLKAIYEHEYKMIAQRARSDERQSTLEAIRAARAASTWEGARALTELQRKITERDPSE